MDTTLVNYLDNVKESIKFKETASLLEAISTVFMYFLFYKYILVNKTQNNCC